MQTAADPLRVSPPLACHMQALKGDSGSLLSCYSREPVLGLAALACFASPAHIPTDVTPHRFRCSWHAMCITVPSRSDVSERKTESPFILSGRHRPASRKARAPAELVNMLQ